MFNKITFVSLPVSTYHKRSRPPTCTRKVSRIKAGAQLTFTCSKSTMETLEKCVKYVQS